MLDINVSEKKQYQTNNLEKNPNNSVILLCFDICMLCFSIEQKLHVKYISCFFISSFKHGNFDNLNFI